jgi:hypothetical protein
VGYRRGEILSSQVFVNVLFIIWGTLEVYLMAWNYSDLSSYQARNLRLWDYVTMLTWALKGFIWVSLGLIFSGVVLVKKLRNKQ